MAVNPVTFMIRSLKLKRCPPDGRHRAWVFLIVILCVFPRMAFSDDVEYHVKTGLREEYSDNLFFDEDHKEAGWSTVLLAEAGIKNSSERLKSSLSGQWTRTYIKDFHELNNDDWTITGGMDWNLYEKTSGSVHLSLGEDSNVDSYLLSTGLLLETKKHAFHKGDVSLNHRFSELFSSELTLNYSEETTESDTDDTGNFDLASRGASVGMVFQADERTTVQLYSGYGVYDYDTSSVDQIFAFLGFNRNVCERLSFFCNMGSRYTTYTYDVLTGIDMNAWPFRYIYGEERYDTWGFVGKAGFVFKDEDGSFRFSVDRSLQPSSGNTGAMDRTSVDVSGYTRLTEDLTFRMTGFFRLNKNDEDSGKDEERLKTFGLSPGLSYQMTDDIVITGNYGFSHYRSNAYSLQKNVYKIQADISF